MAANKRKVSMVGIVLRTMLKVLIYFLIIVIFYYGITWAFRFGYSVFDNKAMSEPPGVEKTIEIGAETSVMEAGALLEQEGLISDSKVFFMQSKFYNYNVYPGTYLLNTAMTPKQILSILGEKPAETQAPEEPTEAPPEEETPPEEAPPEGQPEEAGE